jgi:mannitol/fructose-specific phosphotransferase system IIA component (Ntr-type)
MPSVTEYTKPNYIKVIESTDKFKAIEDLALVFKGTDVCGDIDSLTKALKEREEIMSTGIGFGIAIPHAKISAIQEMAFAVGISRPGIAFDSMDGEAVHLMILVAAGEKQHKEYLRLLSNIMSIIKKENVKEMIINAASSVEVLTILQKYS